MVAPLAKSTTVFNRGTSNGLIDVTPVGGHEEISTPGDKEEWKKDQKKEKKKQISLQMKSNMPIRKPSTTFLVCLPWNVASRVTSRHHKERVIERINTPIASKWPP